MALSLDIMNLPGSVHASAIHVADRGCLIIGPSGSGKSSLALQLIAIGAGFISDDIVWISSGTDMSLFLSRPDTAPLPARIEARGVGLLPIEDVAEKVPLRLVVDLSTTETERLPEPHDVVISGRRLPCLHKVDNPAFPAMLLQYLKGMANNAT